MKTKRSKALAEKLMDDLTGDEADQGAVSLVSDDDHSNILGSNIAPKPKLPPESPQPARPRSVIASAPEAVLTQSETLRIAQQRILDLEKEIERLRLENEELAAAGETFRRRSDELRAELDQIREKFDDSKDRFMQEKDVMQNAMSTRDVEVQEFKRKTEELEARLTTNIQKIRVRERELENRLELVKMEGIALARNKDELILDHKRQIDQLKIEIENYQNKTQELTKRLNERQDVLRRTVKALRLALSMIDGGGSSDGSGSNS